jgi:hypothetical protein
MGLQLKRRHALQDVSAFHCLKSIVEMPPPLSKFTIISKCKAQPVSLSMKQVEPCRVVDVWLRLVSLNYTYRAFGWCDFIEFETCRSKKRSIFRCGTLTPASHHHHMYIHKLAE